MWNETKDFAQYGRLCGHFLASNQAAEEIAESYGIDYEALDADIGYPVDPGTLKWEEEEFATRGNHTHSFRDKHSQRQAKIAALPPDLRAAVTRVWELTELMGHWRVYLIQQLGLSSKRNFEEIGEIMTASVNEICHAYERPREPRP